MKAADKDAGERQAADDADRERRTAGPQMTQTEPQMKGSRRQKRRRRPQMALTTLQIGRAML